MITPCTVLTPFHLLSQCLSSPVAASPAIKAANRLTYLQVQSNLPEKSRPERRVESSYTGTRQPVKSFMSGIRSNNRARTKPRPGQHPPSTHNGFIAVEFLEGVRSEAAQRSPAGSGTERRAHDHATKLPGEVWAEESALRRRGPRRLPVATRGPSAAAGGEGGNGPARGGGGPGRLPAPAGPSGRSNHRRISDRRRPPGQRHAGAGPRPEQRAAAAAPGRSHRTPRGPLPPPPPGASLRGHEPPPGRRRPAASPQRQRGRHPPPASALGPAPHLAGGSPAPRRLLRAGGEGGAAAGCARGARSGPAAAAAGPRRGTDWRDGAATAAPARRN